MFKLTRKRSKAKPLGRGEKTELNLGKKGRMGPRNELAQPGYKRR